MLIHPDNPFTNLWKDAKCLLEYSDFNYDGQNISADFLRLYGATKPNLGELRWVRAFIGLIDEPLEVRVNS